MQTPSTLNEGQQKALTGLVGWYRRSDAPYAILTGFAGTGKTYLLSQLLDELRHERTVVTAPTNKAVGVLRSTLGEGFHCATTFSTLGLTMSKNGEVKLLTAGRKPSLAGVKLLVVDEGSMVGESLWGFIQEAVNDYGLRCLVVADFYQLPPVKEAQSACASISPRFELTEVVRNAGAILALANDVRRQQDKLVATFNPVLGDTVERLPYGSFLDRLRQDAPLFLSGQAKAIAWTNVQVDHMNSVIRAQLFPDSALPYSRGDRVSLLAPILREGQAVASTDEEGTVESVLLSQLKNIDVYTIQTRMDSGSIVELNVPTPAGLVHYNARKQELSAFARTDRRMWKSFWEFCEAFAEIRHGYATTAHRSQGSTYESAYVDTINILGNRARTEAFRCLYVAVSRPKSRLVMH